MAQIALANVDQKPRDDWRGRFAWLLNNAVGGQQIVSILAVWYAWITWESGSTIYGNNPLNLTCSQGDGCYKGQVGWYQFPGNTRKFAAFDSPESYAAAVSQLLNNTTYRYYPIKTAAQGGNSTAMANAISQSCWVSCSSPGYISSGQNGILTASQTLTSRVAVELPSIDKTISTITSVASGIPTLASALGNNNLVLQTPDQVRQVAAQLAAKYGGNSNDYYAWLIDFIGKNSTDIPMNFPGIPGYNSTKNADASANAVVDPLTAIANALGFIMNPANWVRVFTFLIGLVLAFIGSKMVFDSAIRVA